MNIHRVNKLIFMKRKVTLKLHNSFETSLLSSVDVPFNRSAPFSCAKGMASKLKRPAPSFFLLWESDRAGIKKLGS